MFGQTDFASKNIGASLAQMNNPIGLAVSLIDGALYVADSSNFRILKFLPPFQPSRQSARLVYTTATAPLTEPQCLVLDSSDNLYCSDASHWIFMFLRGSTTVARRFGGPDGGTPSASTLNLPGGLALDSASNL